MSKEDFNQARLFAYCHDSVGIGHLARTTAICRRISRAFPSSTFLIATGTPYVSLFQDLSRTDYIKLPALAKEKAHTYRSKYFALPMERLLQCREAMLQNTVEYFDPAVVLVDKAPLGVCGELLPALKWLRAHRPNVRIIFGMRDVEDAPEATVAEWERAGVPEMLETCFDEIWVYGMRNLFDVVKEYRLSPVVQSKLRFMGYVSEGVCDHEPMPPRKRPFVLVTVGAGTDGEFLLRTYLDEAAQRLSARGMKSIVVGGPDLPQAVASDLRERALQVRGVRWVTFDPCLNCRIRDAELVVSMGGYNTLCQIVRNQKRALVVPRITPRLEQAIRARLWSERGLVHVAEPTELTPKRLADRVCRLLGDHSEPPAAVLDLRGLDRITKRFDSFWKAETLGATSVRV